MAMAYTTRAMVKVFLMPFASVVTVLRWTWMTQNGPVLQGKSL